MGHPLGGISPRAWLRDRLDGGHCCSLKLSRRHLHGGLSFGLVSPRRTDGACPRVESVHQHGCGIGF